MHKNVIITNNNNNKYKHNKDENIKLLHKKILLMHN